MAGPAGPFAGCKGLDAPYFRRHVDCYHAGKVCRGHPIRLPRRELNPVTIYAVLGGGYTFFLQVVASYNLVFQTREAGLDPLQLVLVGTLMEASIFLWEVPTGLVADIYGRRASVIAGLVIMGLGVMLTGAAPEFATIVAGTMIWGFGYTFISGARQAWIADEVGIDAAGPVYLRTSQIQEASRLVAIPLSMLLAGLALNLPILLGGASFVLLGGVMLLTMPERGFRRPAGRPALSLESFTGTFGAGRRLVLASPLLITVFGIMFFYGAASEGFDRLWVAHFDRDLGLPDAWGLDPLVFWFGVLRLGSALASIAFVELARRCIDTTSHATVSRSLFAINLGQVLSLFVFAFAGSFEVGMFAFWLAIALSAMYEPLRLAWLNQNIDSSVRATVLSMSSQMDAIGQIAGGPFLGLIGKTRSLSAALFGAGLCLAPALLLYVRAFGQDRPRTPQPSEASRRR